MENNSSEPSVLKSKSFLEKLLLIAVSGMMIPIIMLILNSTLETRQKSIERLRSHEQKLIETQKIQETSLSEARRKFWDDISRTILTYETIALDVSWFKTPGYKDEKLFNAAYERYNDKIVPLIVEWRIAISRASTLASPDIALALEKFLADIFSNQDSPMVYLVNNAASSEDWIKQHTKNEEFVVRANELITMIAVEMGLNQIVPDQSLGQR